MGAKDVGPFAAPRSLLVERLLLPTRIPGQDADSSHSPHRSVLVGALTVDF